VTALLVVLIGVLAGCSNAPDRTPPGRTAPDRPATAPVTSAVGADATRSRAAELQSGLTHLLVERVHVTAAARAAVRDTDRAEAGAALEEASTGLADLLGASFSGAREQLLVALRTVDRRGLQQADTLRTGSDQDRAAALEGLRMAQGELAATIRRVVPRLPEAQVRERLDGDLTAQLAVRGEDGYARLRAASRRAPATAALLAAGIAADRDLGPAGSRAATLRADLTGLLTEHVQLAGALAGEPLPLPGAAAALHDNGADLTALLATAYPSLPAGFSRVWDAHVDRLVALAADPSVDLRRQVLAFPAELGAELARHVRGLPASATATGFTPLLTALAVAVEAGGSPGGHAALRRASATVPVASALVAAAVAQDRRYA